MLTCYILILLLMCLLPIFLCGRVVMSPFLVAEQLWKVYYVNEHVLILKKILFPVELEITYQYATAN